MRSVYDATRNNNLSIYKPLYVLNSFRIIRIGHTFLSFNTDFLFYEQTEDYCMSVSNKEIEITFRLRYVIEMTKRIENRISIESANAETRIFSQCGSNVY